MASFMPHAVETALPDGVGIRVSFKSLKEFYPHSYHQLSLFHHRLVSHSLGHMQAFSSNTTGEGAWERLSLPWGGRGVEAAGGI